MFFLKSKRGLMDPIKTEHWLSSTKPVRDSNTCVWMLWIKNHYILKRRQYAIYSTVNWIGQDWPCSHIRMVIVKSSWILKLFSFPVISSSSHPCRMSNDLTRRICKKNTYPRNERKSEDQMVSFLWIGVILYAKYQIKSLSAKSSSPSLTSSQSPSSS